MNWEGMKWIYITTSKLTNEAQREYDKIKNDIELWDDSNLEKYIEEFRGGYN